MHQVQMIILGLNPRNDWRRMRDLNPRKVALYTLSKRAHSAAMRILQYGPLGQRVVAYRLWKL